MIPKCFFVFCQAVTKICVTLMGFYMKELKINTPLGCAFSTHILLWANSGQNPDRPHGR